jgi:hypothetical protein
MSSLIKYWHNSVADIEDIIIIIIIIIITKCREYLKFCVV